MGSPLSLWAGKSLLAGYRLRQLLGKGSFGQVWEAKTPEGDQVALKFLRCESSNAAAKEVRSILNLTPLRHPNLTRLYNVWADRGYVVVTMELAEGSLLDLLNLCQQDFGVPLPREHVVLYLTQAAAGIDFLNAHHHLKNGRRVGIQHGDIKPSNILISGGKVCICDFGLATMIGDAQTTHVSAGTPMYAAPEVFRGQISDFSDQYSLAVTYCELRTGRRTALDPSAPFDAASLSPNLSLLSDEERPIVARALSRVPHDRWPSCGHFMARLKVK